jgi:hypothetical protein
VVGGYCCWPGQSVTELGSCTGAPICPPGRVAAGADCVVAASMCAEGRIAVEGSYCCWPGQHATAEGLCIGPPICPAGLVAEGSGCRPSATPPIPPVAPAAPVATFHVPFADEPAPTSGPRREVRTGLLAGGIAMFLGGWLGAGITFSPNLPSAPFAAFGWVPFAHLGVAFDGGFSGLAITIGAVATTMEIVGLAMAVAGQIGREVDTDVVRLGAPGADAGLTLALPF